MDTFSGFFNITVCCVFSLESHEYMYTQHTVLEI